MGDKKKAAETKAVAKPRRTGSAQEGLVTFSEEQVKLISRTIAVGATPDELAMFVGQCKRTGLDPFTRQIYFTKSKKPDRDGNYRVSIIVSIDGFRVVAERSAKYRGQTKAEWCGEDGAWKDVWLDRNPPAAARVSVLRSDFDEPCCGVATLAEAAQRYPDGNLSGQWAQRPAHMLAKVAEALALRKAFPNDLSGLYSTEEMSATVDPHPDAIVAVVAPSNEPASAESAERLRLALDAYGMTEAELEAEMGGKRVAAMSPAGRDMLSARLEVLTAEGKRYEQKVPEGGSRCPKCGSVHSEIPQTDLDHMGNCPTCALGPETSDVAAKPLTAWLDEAKAVRTEIEMQAIRDRMQAMEMSKPAMLAVEEVMKSALAGAKQAGPLSA